MTDNKTPPASFSRFTRFREALITALAVARCSRPGAAADMRAEAFLRAKEHRAKQ